MVAASIMPAMTWSPTVNMLIPRLANDDVAVRDAALEEALDLPDAELALVSAIDLHLSSWRAHGTMLRQGDRLYLVIRVHVDDTVTRLVAALRPYSLVLVHDGAPPGPLPSVLPAGWGHPGLAVLSTCWPLASVEGLDGLVSLRLEDAGLEQTPRGLGTLSRLEQLWLCRNALTTLPAELGRLEALQDLDLSDNRLTTLPDELGSLRNLRRLCVPRNHLRTLPASVGELESLDELLLNANQLTSLPSTITRLRRLRVLRLAGNALTCLPDELPLLPALATLSLYRNHLTCLPCGLGRLTEALRHGLRVTHNRLETLPDGLGDLPSLLLGHNPLRHLPTAQLEAMTRLSFLVIDDDAPLDEPSRAWLRDLHRIMPRVDFVNDDPDADDDDPSHDPH